MDERRLDRYVEIIIEIKLNTFFRKWDFRTVHLYFLLILQVFQSYVVYSRIIRNIQSVYRVADYIATHFKGIDLVLDFRISVRQYRSIFFYCNEISVIL